jgi:outer membrane protein
VHNIVSVYPAALEEIFENLPELKKSVIERMEKLGLTCKLVTATSAAALLDNLAADVDGVYFSDLVRVPRNERQAILRSLKTRKIATFATAAGWVEDGALMSLTDPEEDIFRGQRIAAHLRRIIDGDEAGQLPVLFDKMEKLQINWTTANTIGVFPDLVLAAEAAWVQVDRDQFLPPLSLNEAIDRGLETNLDFQAGAKQVDQGAAGVKQSMGRLLPSVTAHGSVVVIDPDRASAFGPAEQSTGLSATARQILFDERTWTDYMSKKESQKGTVEELEVRRLDLILQLCRAYFKLLRSQNVRQIQMKNLDQARRNLGLAEARKTIGVARSSEAYRWRITIAQGQKDLFNTQAAVRKNELELNRLLNQPLTTELVLINFVLDKETGLPKSGSNMVRFMTDRITLLALQEFVEEEALHQSREITALDHKIEAQKRVLRGTRRKIWLPTFAVEGGIRGDWRFGKGSSADLDGDGSLDEFDKFAWHAGLTASIPLVEGGSRYAEVQAVSARLAQLNLQRASLAQTIQQRAYQALYDAAASSAATRVSRNASEAARNNLELVLDAYQHGNVSNIDLVDAQNQVLVQTLAETDSLYAAVFNLIQLQRALGHYYFLDTREEQLAFVHRLKALADKKRKQLALDSAVYRQPKIEK